MGRAGQRGGMGEQIGVLITLSNQLMVLGQFASIGRRWVAVCEHAARGLVQRVECLGKRQIGQRQNAFVAVSSIPIRLPKELNQARDPKPDNIILSVNTAGTVYWFDAKVASRDELVKRLKEAAQKSPQPEIQLRGDAKANFETIGRVLFDIQSAGLEKVGFITENPPR